ncbi:Putative protein [Zobellia galactanivorans]|uniref:Uncharacterized protein n=1 Tax=Zobellia galactanivorans (strain DSM 12802 / CCUG 47099 / CIP 106680 / NCIMB 13871 / Dsij) TaxID=63186 RepID=G0L5B8_ZOBGA|nr:Putative protein [Zobellia galactanivorans]
MGYVGRSKRVTTKRKYTSILASLYITKKTSQNEVFFFRSII